jgi:hypothetical protein
VIARRCRIHVRARATFAWALTTAVLLACAGEAAAAPSQASFRTPSGNIHCYLTSGGTAQCWVLSARCQNQEGTGYAYSWAFGREDRPSRFCPGDFVQGRRVLPYGSAITKGDARCVSRRSGVTCVQLETGRGFFLSRARQRIF